MPTGTSQFVKFGSLFHGTIRPNLKPILSEGLKPPYTRKELKDFRNLGASKQFKEYESDGIWSVSLTNSRRNAALYAMTCCMAHGFDPKDNLFPIIIEVNRNALNRALLSQRESSEDGPGMFPEANEYDYVDVIPPKAIIAFWTFHAEKKGWVSHAAQEVVA